MSWGFGQDKLYDKTTSMYSPDGRILQLEYARKAMSRGLTTIVIVAKDAVILGGLVLKSKLLIPAKKIYQVDDHIAVSYTGYTADGQVLVNIIRDIAYENRVLLGTEIDVQTLANKLGEYMQQFTQYGGVRPYGVGIVIAGYDINGPGAVFVDPGGSVFGLKAYCIGKECEKLFDILKDKYREDLSREEAIKLAVELIYNAMKSEASKGSEEKKRKDIEREISHERIVLVAIDKEGVHEVPNDEIKKLLEEFLGGESS